MEVLLVGYMRRPIAALAFVGCRAQIDWAAQNPAASQVHIALLFDVLGSQEGQ